jgi:predicted TPR repeat methyltransferase
LVRIAGSGSVDYDRISKIYDRGRSEAYPETVDTLNRLLKVVQDSLLLDLGCGTGNYISALQSLADRVTGIDMSRGMIE